MAIFSRGKRAPQPDVTTPAAQPIEAAASAAADPGAQVSDQVSSTDAAAEASVSVSTSSFRGMGSAAPSVPAEPSTPARPAPETAPAQTETVPGLRDNVMLADALTRAVEMPGMTGVIEVARQLLQGQLFLRVKGDARTLLSEGRPLPLALATVGDKTYVVAYSSGAAMRASVQEDGQVDTSALGQPVLVVIRHVLASPYDGLLLDASSTPARAILPRDLLEKMVSDIDPELTVKTLLAAERTPATASAVARALSTSRFWVAVNTAGDSGRMGVAEARSPDGERLIEIHSHPLEVVALGRGDQPAPMTLEQLGKAIATDEGISGAIVDPAGPWIRLSREDLSAFISG